MRRPVAPRLLALCAAAAALASSCDREPRAPAAPPAEVLVARDVAAALFEAERIGEAEAALAPLLQRDPVDPRDLVAMAIVRLAKASTRDEFEAVDALLARALERTPDDAPAHFVRGQLHHRWGQDRAQALASLRRAHELAPGDPATELALAASLHDRWLDDADDGARAEAERLLEGVLARGVENAGSWYVTALYRLSDLVMERDRERALALRREQEQLVARGITQPSDAELSRGTLGTLHPPTPIASGAAALEGPRLGRAFGVVGPAPRALRLSTPSARWEVLTAAELGVDAPAGFDPEHYAAGGAIGPLGVLASDGQRVVSITPGDEGRWTGSVVIDAPHAGIEAADLDADWQGRSRDEPGESTAEILLTTADGALSAWRRDGAAYAPLAAPLARFGAAPAALAVADLDHEGDVDLVAALPGGVRVARSDDGAAGRFALREDALGDVDATWVVAEDLDSDGDTDLLAGGAGGVRWIDSLRQERFADRSADLPSRGETGRAPLVADFDGDGFVDAWFPGDGARWMGRAGERFERVEPPERTRSVLPPAASVPVAADLDLDTALDVLWIDAEGRLAGLLAVAQPSERALAPLDLRAAPGPLLVADVDGDGALELVHGADGSIAIVDLEGGAGRGLRLALRGIKDNARGVGALVEVRTGARYQRLRWDGEPRLIGLGAAERADVIRVTWPNGVVQTVLDARAGEERVVEQIEGLIGSCPFLYTWNGETFTFVTDVLGITPLGLPMAPGMLVPPDHDEYVLVRAEQLAAQDGAYVVQLTEELREVTYLDEARLHVLDHPEGTELFPNERFTFPPFPAHDPQLVAAPLAPLAARDQDGRDWTTELSREDGALAIPFQAHRGQFLGLATPHTLELSFDAAAVRGAGRLRLVMCGWFYWSDASTNVASARHPTIDFVPPLLEVPDGKGGWRSAGPPLGFPAGKLKTMVVDVTDVFVRDDPRLRLTSSLRLYWDALRLATCEGDHARSEHVLPATRARLWERGFSATVWLHEGERLEWFDWNRLAPEPRWNQHPGRYTRHGDVLELVTATDDRFAILGAGDALELAFDARALPPLREGWRRDFLLFLDGWAKDRDPNTVDALFVEPLPFHGMSGYPYGEDERYPDTPELRAYREQWNTRAAKSWIAPLSGSGARAASAR